MNTKKPPLPIFIFLFCLGILCSFPMQGQQRDTQKEYNVDSTLYAYYNVPESVYHALMTAPSHGKYLAAHVKGHYAYKRIG